MQGLFLHNILSIFSYKISTHLFFYFVCDNILFKNNAIFSNNNFDITHISY